VRFGMRAEITMHHALCMGVPNCRHSRCTWSSTTTYSSRARIQDAHIVTFSSGCHGECHAMSWRNGVVGSVLAEMGWEGSGWLMKLASPQCHVCNRHAYSMDGPHAVMLLLTPGLESWLCIRAYSYSSVMTREWALLARIQGVWQV